MTATAAVQVTEPAPPVNPWIELVQQLTDDLLSDTKALDTYDRARALEAARELVERRSKTGAQLDRNAETLG